MDKAARIRELNDRFRRSLVGGRAVVTRGVAALPVELKIAALEHLRTFDAFTEENDPHGEHDFGNFSIGERQFYFKIDYYDSHMAFGSADPSDPAQTTRVLTLMLAEEYWPANPATIGGVSLAAPLRRTRPPERSHV